MTSDVVARMRAMADDVYSSTEAALYREGADEVERLTRALDAAEAQARGAQYREREARNEAAMLRARLDGAQGVAEVQRACAVMQAAIATIALDRWRRADAEIAALRAQAQPDAGDLAGLARREAVPVTRRQWRACARCGQCFWLADDEAVPGHGVRDAWGADRACGAVVTSEGSEGR